MTAKEIARMIDISAVRADSTKADVDNVIAAAKEYRLICAFAMPTFMSYMATELKGEKDINIGGVVGFPSGADTLSSKIFQAKECAASGCTEVDMVMNIGKLKSGMYDDVADEIAQIHSVVAPLPLKVIIEVALLTDQEVIKASKIVCDSKATYLKSGTGWAGATTLHHVELMKKTVGDGILIKVAGGVRDLATLKTMAEMGVSRFGIGYKAVLDIMKESSL